MRTVELSDEVFERAKRAAEARGVKVEELINEVVDLGIPPSPQKSGIRVEFPVFKSNAPGSLILTKEMIDAVELDDDLRRSGL